MADTDVQTTVGPEPATLPLENRAEEPVAATAQTSAPASVAAETTAPSARPPSQAHAAAPGYATHRPAGRGPGARREGGRERGGYGGRPPGRGVCGCQRRRGDHKGTGGPRRPLPLRRENGAAPPNPAPAQHPPRPPPAPPPARA